MPVVLVIAALAAADLGEQAEQAFAEGLRRRDAGQPSRALFLEAARAAEELRRQGVNNATLYRTLGNAYLLADDLPRAVLAYRVGLRLAPADAALRANLAAAREQVVFADGSALGRPPDVPAPLGGRWLFVLALLAYAAGWAVLTRWRMTGRGVLRAGGLALLAVALAGGVVWWRDQARRSTRPVVVLAADDVVLRQGNARAFPPRHDTPLQRGVEAELLNRRDGWLKIALSGGEVGWVAEADAVVEGD